MDPETSVRDRTGQDSLFFKRESSTNSLLVHVCPSTGWFLFCCLNVPPGAVYSLVRFCSACWMPRHGSVYLLAGFSLLVKFQLWMCVFTGLALFCVLTVSPWLSVFTGWVNVPLWIHIINVWNLSCSFSSMSHLSACFYLLVVVVVIINVILPLVKVRCPTMAQCI